MTDEPENALKAAIGLRLRWVRELNDKTQQEVAKALGHQGQYSRWENGTRWLPPHIAIEFCDRLQISMDYIYRGHLTGVHPDLAMKLLELHPEELVPPPIYTGWRTDKDLP